MRLIKCKGCGQIISASGEQAYCDACRRKAKQATVIRERICRACGVHFDGAPRAWYCPECRKERRRAADRLSKRRQAAGTTRKLGSTDLCVRCGAEYTVEGGKQRYCPSCAKDAIAEAIRPAKRIYMAGRKVDAAASKDARRTNRRVCVVCGSTFTRDQPTSVCSPECAAIRKREWQRRADEKRQPRKRKKEETP